MEEQVKGTILDVAGKVQDAVGGGVGDPGLQLKGKAKQAAGQFQQSYGEALDALRGTAVRYPLASLAVVAGIGFVLGALWASRD